MIKIKKSEITNRKETTKEQLLQDTEQHILHVTQGLDHLGRLLHRRGLLHDKDKITEIEGFHADFTTDFKKADWWKNHRKISRHHINSPDGIPNDVDMLDVLEHIIDCVMAAKARKGKLQYALGLPSTLLQKAFENTWKYVNSIVEVEEGIEYSTGKLFCPICKCDSVCTERRIDGDNLCRNCGHKWKEKKRKCLES